MRIPRWLIGALAACANWRCVVGPRGLAAGEVAYREDALARLVATPDWQRELKDNGWDPQFMKSADSRAFMQRQHELARRTLAELGMAKR